MPKDPERHPHNRGNSEQSVQTPSLFLDAVEARYGEIVVDLAADVHNRAVSDFIGEQEDSLLVDWARRLRGGLGWLNPEYGFIRPWANKCREESYKSAHVVMLTPASVSSKWFKDHVIGSKSRPAAVRVEALLPKLSFVGHDHQFTKDLILSVYGFKNNKPGFFCWEWTKLRGRELKDAELESRARRASRILAGDATKKTHKSTG